jgi:nitrite reductase/ring-hydroxylating ferredoxin subunit/uncharacterized membrane protein
MAENVALDLIERQEWIDPLADQVQKAVGNVFESAGEPGQKVKNFLHGTWLGHPLHSAVTDVPIGAWTSAMVMDAMEDVTGRSEFGRAADTAVAIGLAGAVVSAVSGITDWQSTDGNARKIGLTHGLLNMSGALLFGASLGMRRNGSRSAGRGFSTLGFVAALGAAYLGGKLVYKEQIGVDHTAGQQFPTEFTPVLPDADLAEGTMKRVDVRGSRILLVRREQRVFAISEVCSHLGGPLSKGEFEGCAVRCPWHGSRFSLEDGRVLDGPAVHPARRLYTRIENGQIEVKSSGQ